MGIFGAMTTAVSGLNVQAAALENISGNISNSQTTGFKKVETSFADMVAEGATGKQSSGSVSYNSRYTNKVGGDIKPSATPTHMALRGDGFFVVQQRTGYFNNTAQFNSNDIYTRRGDFDVDREGYLVNGAGHYLKGLPVDSLGNVSGNVPVRIQIPSNSIPAKRTDNLDYKITLPDAPKTQAFKASNAAIDQLLSPTLQPGGNPVSSITTSAQKTLFENTSVSGSSVTVFSDLGSPTNLDIYWAKLKNKTPASAQINGQLVGGVPATSPTAPATMTVGGVLVNVPSFSGANTPATRAADFITAFNTAKALPANASALASYTVTADASGALTITNTAGNAAVIPSVPDAFGVTSPASTTPFKAAVPTAIPDTWAMYYKDKNGNYQAIPESPGGQPKQFTFNNDNGTLAASNGMSLQFAPNLSGFDGSTHLVTLNYGAGRIAQYFNSTGVPSDITLERNGYPSGVRTGLEVSSTGRVKALYSNDQRMDIFEIITVTFPGANGLRRLDGNALAATAESGAPVQGAPGKIIGGSLEASNVDISDEFTKMIVTQQAYAANTKVVSTSNSMLQETINMIR